MKKNKFQDEKFECMNCGAEGAGATAKINDIVYDVYPSGWGIHIQPDADYMLICKTCLEKK